LCYCRRLIPPPRSIEGLRASSHEFREGQKEEDKEEKRGEGEPPVGGGQREKRERRNRREQRIEGSEEWEQRHKRGNTGGEHMEWGERERERWRRRGEGREEKGQKERKQESLLRPSLPEEDININYSHMGRGHTTRRLCYTRVAFNC
jgi:hypothetical protein